MVFIRPVVHFQYELCRNKVITISRFIYDFTRIVSRVFKMVRVRMRLQSAFDSRNCCFRNFQPSTIT